jgi:hypothetical protein
MSRRLGKGVTRTVWRVGRWAVKVPNRGWLVRGYLANQSEWHQRHRPDVNRPTATLFHLALVAPLADQLRDPRDDQWHLERNAEGYSDEESKPQSWGLFGGRWLLLDFDQAWRQPRRGLVGRAYYGNQERLARKWMRP